MSRVLVTGGGGFLGQALVRALRAGGYTVRSFSRRAHAGLAEWGVEQTAGDLADASAVAAAVSGCDLVFHAAAKAGVWGPWRDYYRTNVEGTRNVIEACRRCRVKRLVYTSSPSVVFDKDDMEGVDESAPYPRRHEIPYAQTKAEAERLVRAANDGDLATVALRPHLMWGPGDNHILPRLVAHARAGRLRRVGRGGKRFDTVYIDDAARAHLLAAERLRPGAAIAGRVYFISQGEPVEIWDMIDRLLHAVGAPPSGRPVPVELAWFLAACSECYHRVLRRSGEPRLTRFVVRELSSAHWFNIEAARRDLGYEPEVSLEEGLRRLAAHYPKGYPAAEPAAG